MGRKGQILEVRRNRTQLCLQWRIPGFLDLSSGGCIGHDSPHFSFSDGYWHMSVYPDWMSSKQVCLSLHRDDASIFDQTLDVTVGVSGRVEKRRLDKPQQFVKGVSLFWKDFCSRSDLSEQNLMPQGALTVTCDMKVPCRPARGGEKVLEDFAKLLASSDGSDITMQVGGVQFQVHSAVLFARCPALSVSLRHESRERASKMIVIEDCEPNIFSDFLQYLYTGSVQSLNEQNVFGLYRVADKYLVEDLKQLCSEHILNTLSVRTFSDTVRLALIHEESNLLERAVAFATRNILSILHSVGWQKFNRECPTEANEVLIKCLGPLCESQTFKH